MSEAIKSLFSETDMQVNLTPIINGEVKELPFSFTQSVSDEAAGIYFKGLDLTPAGDMEVSGKVSDISGFYELDCMIRLPYETHCSRCGAPVTDVCVCEMHRIVSAEAERGDDEGYIIYADRALLLDGPVYEELSIGFPSKPLCKTDCRGLCPICGRDLNEGDCEHSHANNNETDTL